MAAGLIGAGASIVGDLISAHGQSSTNAANMALQKQSQDWQTMMSNTAMQRRVQDLKAANLNPLLAVGQQGASTPSLGPAQMQNPKAAYGNLGSQATNAIATAAQVANLNADADNKTAQANLTRAQTPGDIFTVKADGTLDYNNANGGKLGNMALATSAKGIQVQDETIKSIIAQVNLTNTQVDQNKLKNDLLRLDKQTQTALLPKLISSQQAEMRAQGIEAGQRSAVMSGPKGYAIEILRQSIGAGSGGSTLINQARHFVP